MSIGSVVAAMCSAEYSGLVSYLIPTRQPARLEPRGSMGSPMKVEFLGIPRERAGIAELELDAETLGQLLAALEQQFPALGTLMEAGHLHRSILASLNGDRFVSDPRTRLSTGDCVLILSADAGG